MPDQATGKFTGAYRLNLPLRELGEIPIKGEDNDDCWEIVLKISVDFEGGYPLHFASGCSLPGLETFSGKQIKLLKVKLPTY